MTDQASFDRARSLRLQHVLAFGNFIVGMGAFVVVGVLVPIADAFHMTKAQAAFAMTAYAVAYALSSPVLVALTGRVARRNLLVGSLAVFVLAALLTALSVSPGMLMASRVLAAIGAGLFTPAAAAVAVSTSSPEERPAALSRVFGGLTLAQVLGVPVGGYLGYSLGWPSAFIAVAVLGLVAIVCLLRLVPREIPFQPTSLGALGKVLANPAQLLAVLFSTTFLGALYMVYTFLAPLIEFRLEMGGLGVTVIFAAFGVGAVVGNMVGSALTSRLGAGRTLVLLVSAQVFLLPAMTLLPFNLMTGVLLTFFWSVCGWSFMVPQQTRLLGLAPQAQSVILALNAAAIYIAASVGSALGGAAFTYSDLPMVGIFASFAAMAALVHLLVSLSGKYGSSPAVQAG